MPIPAISVSVPGSISSNPLAISTMRSKRLHGALKKPEDPEARPTIPINAVTTALIAIRTKTPVERLFTLTRTKIGFRTNIYGTIYAAIPRRVAVKPVFIGLEPAIPEPANAASATGGVMSATMPK